MTEAAMHQPRVAEHTKQVRGSCMIEEVKGNKAALYSHGHAQEMCKPYNYVVQV